MDREADCVDAEDVDLEPVTECENCGGYLPPWQQSFICDRCQYDQEV